MKGFLALLILVATAAAAWFLPARPRHHYSETGVVYTTNYLTLRVPTGVVGFPPGTRLTARFDLHVPDQETITDGKYTLAVDPQVLTHDIEYAGELASADQLNQDESQARIAQTKAAHAASQHAVELTHAQDIDGVNASMVAASRVGNFSSRLNDPTAAVGAWGGYGAYGYYNGGYPAGSVIDGSTTINRVNIYNVNRGISTSPVTASYMAKGVLNNTVVPRQPTRPIALAADSATGSATVLH